MKHRSIRALIIASIIYLALILSIYWMMNRSEQNVSIVEVVPVQLSMFELSEPVIETPPPVEVEPEPPTPVEPPPIKPEPKPEPIIEPEPVPKPEPVQPKKIVEPKPKPEPKPVPKAVSKPEPKPKPQPVVQEQQPVAEKPVVKPVIKPVEAQPRFSAQQIANAETLYLNELRKQIVRYAKDTYPRRAKRRRWEGEVMIEFYLTQSGRITQLKILQSSGRNILDEAALEIFEKKMALQFKPFPEEIEKSTWLITVPVTYNIL